MKQCEKQVIINIKDYSTIWVSKSKNLLTQLKKNHSPSDLRGMIVKSRSELLVLLSSYTTIILIIFYSPIYSVFMTDGKIKLVMV